MGNKFTFDEQVEDLVKRIVSTYQLETSHQVLSIASVRHQRRPDRVFAELSRSEYDQSRPERDDQAHDDGKAAQSRPNEKFKFVIFISILHNAEKVH